MRKYLANTRLGVPLDKFDEQDPVEIDLFLNIPAWEEQLQRTEQKKREFYANRKKTH